MGRRKKEDTERLVWENDLKVDAEFKLNDELTELFIRCEKIANKFLIDNSTQEEKDDHAYTQTRKDTFVNKCLSHNLNQMRKTSGRIGEDDDLVEDILLNYNDEVSEMFKKYPYDEKGNSKIKWFDLSIENERRPEPFRFNWENPVKISDEKESN